jgi:hypothetical protein
LFWLTRAPAKCSEILLVAAEEIKKNMKSIETLGRVALDLLKIPATTFLSIGNPLSGTVDGSNCDKEKFDAR